MSGSGFSASGRLGGYSPSEINVLFAPRHTITSRRAFVYAHGASGSGMQAMDGQAQAGVTRVCAALARAGFVGLSGDFGGATTFANDTFLTAMEGGINTLLASGQCASDKVILVGASMGMMLASRYAMEHPTKVAGMIGLIPGIDIEDIRTRDALASRAMINTGWGLPVGSYIGGADQTPVPTRGKPLDSANLSAVAAIPTHLFYSTADTVATSAAVDTYAAGRANVTKHVVSSSLDHSDAAIRAVTPGDVVSLCLGWA